MSNTMPIPDDITSAINNMIDAINNQESQKANIHLATISILVASFTSSVEGVETLSDMEQFLIKAIAKQSFRYGEIFTGHNSLSGLLLN